MIRSLRWLTLGAALGLLIVGVGCRGTGKSKTHDGAVAVLDAKSGSKLTGRAVFTRMEGNWVHVRVEIENVKPGIHAVHIHENGDCSSPDGKSAGGHWNPTGKKHGKWGQPDGEFHLGDLGNIQVGKDGRGVLELSTDLWRIGGVENINIVGRSIIVHAGADDMKSQPSGAAGARIGAGKIVIPRR
ncbi:MAG: superoxide dismutase family protein [Planctomycetota bacterium]